MPSTASSDLIMSTQPFSSMSLGEEEGEGREGEGEEERREENKRKVKVGDVKREASRSHVGVSGIVDDLDDIFKEDMDTC